MPINSIKIIKVHAKHVHAYGYSNIFSIDYVTTRTLESHIHTQL